MLVLLVERVSGEEFADFMREEFFEPLGMKHTSIGRPQSKDFVLCAGHYHNTRQIAPFYQDEVLGDKSVYSSAEDMFRWDRSFSDEYILNNETLKLAFTDWEPDRNGLHNYGYGWRILHYPNGESFEYHTGWYRGYTSLFVRLRSTNSCIVILSNRVNKSFMVTYHDLVAILK
jgi:CubicO group peptidase (beta-lactamase class C family)